MNASIGSVRAMNAEAGTLSTASSQLEEDLRWVQNKLFDVGSILATAPGQTFKNMPTVTADDVTKLEHMIDRCQEDLEPLKEFILPGGGKVSATLHQARTICRRAERIGIRLAREETVAAELNTYLNRLSSDALFVWARWVAKTKGEPEFLWQPSPARPSTEGMKKTAGGRSRLILVLGGAASGKSQAALDKAGKAGPKAFVATGQALDREMTARIARHRATRSADWATAEVPRELAAWFHRMARPIARSSWIA